MKRSLPLLAAVVCCTWLGLSLPAQDNPSTRAAAIAARDAAEERYKRLSSAVEDLWAAKAEQDRRLSALTEEIRNVRAENSRNDTSKYITRDELNRLVKTVEEIERKREADKKLILDQFEELKRDLRSDLRKLVSAPPPSSAPKSQKTARSDDSEEKTGRSAAAPAANQEGVWYTIEPDNTLLAIVAAHNKEWQKQSRKTSLKLVQEANPGLEPKSMKVGQKIFIPLVPQ